MVSETVGLLAPVVTPADEIVVLAAPNDNVVDTVPTLAALTEPAVVNGIEIAMVCCTVPAPADIVAVGVPHVMVWPLLLVVAPDCTGLAIGVVIVTAVPKLTC